MSAETVRRVAAPFLEAAETITSAAEGIRLLRELCEAMARSTADLVFLKLRTEGGWTAEEARDLKAASFQLHLEAIVDTIHAFGGTVDMADTLVQAAAVAFATRLDDLTSAVGAGGES